MLSVSIAILAASALVSVTSATEVTDDRRRLGVDCNTDTDCGPDMHCWHKNSSSTGKCLYNDRRRLGVDCKDIDCATEDRRLGQECPRSQPRAHDHCYNWATCGYQQGSLVTTGENVDVLDWEGGVKAVCTARNGDMFDSQAWKWVITGPRPPTPTPKPTGCPQHLPADWSQCKKYMTCGYVNDRLAESFVDVLRTPGGVQAVCRMGHMGNAWYNQEAVPDHGPVVYGRRLDEGDCPEACRTHRWASRLGVCRTFIDRNLLCLDNSFRTTTPVFFECSRCQRRRPETDPTKESDSNDATKDADLTAETDATKDATTDAVSTPPDVDEMVAPTENSAKDPKHIAAWALANFYAMTGGIGGHTKLGQLSAKLQEETLQQLSMSDDQLQSKLTAIQLLLTPVIGKNTAAKAVEQLKTAYHAMQENKLAIHKQSESWVGVSQLAGLIHDGKVNKAEGLKDLTDALYILVFESDKLKSVGAVASQLEDDLAAVKGN